MKTANGALGVFDSTPITAYDELSIINYGRKPNFQEV
jgi:hypothetical protein